MVDMKIQVKNLVSFHRLLSMKQHHWQDMKFQQKLQPPNKKKTTTILFYCGGLTLSDCQVPTKMLSHSPPQQDRERKYEEKFMNWDKDRVIAHQLQQLLSQVKQIWFGEINLIYWQLIKE